MKKIRDNECLPTLAITSSLYLVLPAIFVPSIIFFLLILLKPSEYTQTRSPEKNSVYFVLLFFLIIPTLFIEVPEIIRRFLFIVPIFLVIALSKSVIPKTSVRKAVPLAVLFFLFLRVFLFLGKTFSSAILTILGLGYDNSHHFAMFQAVLHTDQISRYSLNGPWTIPSWFAQYYPVGNQIVWGALLAPLRLQNSSIEETLALFLLTIFAALFGMVFLASKMVCNSCLIGSRLQVKIIIALLAAVFVFGSYGYIVVSGFPPLLTGCLLLSGILLLGGEKYSRLATLLQVCCVALIALTYVTLTAPAGLSLLFLKMRQIKYGSGIQKLRGALILSALSLSIAFITFRVFELTAGTMGWRQILADGGIESITPNVIRSSVLIALLFCAIAIRRSILMQAMAVLIIACWLIYFAISLTTIHFNGVVSYYAQKQGYVAIAFTVVAAFVILIESLRTKNKIIRYCGAGLFGLFAAFQFSHSTHPRDFTTGFMSSVPIGIDRISSQKSVNQLIINGPQLLSAHRLTQKASMTLVLNSNNDIDLTSRWMNALNNTWTDETWFFYNGVSNWYERPELFIGLTSSSINPIVITDDISSIDPELKNFLTKLGFQIFEVARH